jgi:aminoglycoside 6'-N-acetyltransferase
MCVNDKTELLMVFQGRSEEQKTWCVPAGVRDKSETFGEWCIRVIEEKIDTSQNHNKDSCQKRKVWRNHSFEVHYYLVKIAGGTPRIQDPDGLIHAIR